MLKILTLGLIVIIVGAGATFGIRAYIELSDPIIVEGIKGRLLKPPPLTVYGGVILRKDLAFLQKTNYTCGPATLALACKAMGVKASEEEIAFLSSCNKEGTSMLNLSKAAREKGLVAQGLFLTLDDFRKMIGRRILIAFIEKSHFGLVIGHGSDDGILIIDPNYGVVLLKENRFRRIWDGYVLSLGKRKEGNDN
ncbi:MAG: cysteine peptidase family C39 domain-containing protein [bacterium]